MYLRGLPSVSNTLSPPTYTLDIQTANPGISWVEFSGGELAGYINDQRSANGGDDVASFSIEWQGCPNSLDCVIFEDNDDTAGTGNTPQLYPMNPTSVRLKSFSVAQPSVDGWQISGISLMLLTSSLLMSLFRRRHSE